MNTAATNPTGTASKIWKRVWSGIWRHRESQTLYERPKLLIKGNERWTFRSLGTKHLKIAKEELYRRKSARSSARLGLIAAGVLMADIVVGQIIRRYQEDGCKDRKRRARPNAMHKAEEGNCQKLLEFWEQIPAEKANVANCDRYHDWRCAQVTHGTGERTVDLELNTLANAFYWACRVELISQNSFVRPSYCSDRDVRHCRLYMPADADELHAAARILMEVPASVILGFQLLFQGLTGLRTIEALALRRDEGPNEPGWITPDGKSLFVRRAKGQELVNPFCAITPALREMLDELNKWVQQNHPSSPWFFPSSLRLGKPVSKGALAQGLRRIRKRLARKMTPHGLRAFFVTVRRSHGVMDSQIAWELGHTSGGKTLAEVYGGVPPHWLHGDGPKMSWRPSRELAWASISTPDNIINLPTGGSKPAQEDARTPA